MSTGGGQGSGGMQGTGGTTSTGGATGGTPSSGGNTSTGGRSAMGGTTSSGGSTSPGVRSATGGTNGAGGSARADASADAAPRMGTPCNSQSDCGPATTLLYCRAPGEPLGCGTCQMAPTPCTSDAQCLPDGGSTGDTRICEVPPSSQCYCSATKVCLDGCRTSADCAAGQGCNTSHACQSTCVQGDGSCPVDYLCGASGFCTQKSCTNDAECSVACVKGYCYGSRGACQPPAA